MKTRIGPDGLHLFDRVTGLNVLLDEYPSKPDQWARAPRQISIALTNLCDLQCPYCYAPKHRASISLDRLRLWITELDALGCLGLGLGGGEPTLHPEFIEIVRMAAEISQMAITFTSHGHRLSSSLLGKIAGYIHFVRISVDGVGATYTHHRRRSFDALLTRLDALRSIAPFGLNVVVNERTATELDSIAAMASECGASELLLLPEQATKARPGASKVVLEQMAAWAKDYRGNVRLAVSEIAAEGLPIADPLPRESGLRAYAHINASGHLMENSFATSAVPIDDKGVLAALDRLKLNVRGQV